jgi:hypothetical protein
MTPDQIFSLARDAVMVVVTLLVFYWGRDRKHVADAIESEFKSRDARIAALEKMMEHAGDKSSRLTGKVQEIIGRLDRLPSVLREDFLPRTEADLLREASEHDRAALWEAIKRRKGGTGV